MSFIHIPPGLSTDIDTRLQNKDFPKDIIKDIKVVRPGRIELPSDPWQGPVLPLNHDRAKVFY